MDSQVQIDGYLVDLIDDAWRSDTLPEDDIAVPTWELSDPEADSGDIHLTLKEQEQKWTDIMLSSLSEHHKQCSQPSCKQLDFLPLVCKCGFIFCSEHFNSHTQDCESSKLLSENELKTIQNTYVCSHSNCKERNVIPLICDKCKKHFCIKHRHLVRCEEKSPELLQKEKERYAEPIRKFNEAKAIVDEQVRHTLNEAKKKSKNKEMANKVQLMRIKGKATGLKSIPTSDRVYFNVTYTSNDGERTLPIFVSNQWTVGRAIDAIAEEHKLQNNNNKSNEKKLRLFKKDNGNNMSKNVSEIISNLLKENYVTNGEHLVIAYVTADADSL